MDRQKEKSVLDALESDIYNADIPEQEKNRLLKNFLRLKDQKINLMVTGATGCGKSSTNNALFKADVAKVGVGVDPETMDISKYELDNLVLWDSPGLGDGKEADNRHAKNIINKLAEKDKNGNLLIDLVLVILDGSTRDLGTSYELINNVIIPNLGKDKENRILVAINQCDAAMKGHHWDVEHNRPEPPLAKFLDEKVLSVKKRIKEGTGVDVDPIYYSAGYTEEDGVQAPPYNLHKLLYYIIKFTPKEKRLSYVSNINPDASVWKDNDDLKDYSKGIWETFSETWSDCVSEGASIGGDIGSIFGEAGEAIGQGVGSVVGGVVGLAKGAWDAVTDAVTCGCYNPPDGEALISRYYETAPQIVAQINRQPNREEILKSLNENYLSKCLTYIENGENEKCKDLYVSMMNHLFDEQGRWKQ